MTGIRIDKIKLFMVEGMLVPERGGILFWFRFLINGSKKQKGKGKSRWKTRIKKQKC